MLYRRVDKTRTTEWLRVDHIFASISDAEKGLDFNGVVRLFQIEDLDKESNKDGVFQLFNGKYVDGKNAVILMQDENTNSIINSNEYCYMHPSLVGCAAVIFYLIDNKRIIVHAYHAAGGIIDVNVLNSIIKEMEVKYVIYATPIIKETNGIQVDLLTNDSRIGADKVCMIDGFKDNVLADSMGNIYFK